MEIVDIPILLLTARWLSELIPSSASIRSLAEKKKKQKGKSKNSTDKDIDL